MVQNLTTDIESCAGGVSDSITALRAKLRGEVVSLKAEIQIGLAAGRPGLAGHTVTYVKNGDHVMQVSVPQRIAIVCVTEP